MAETAPQRGNGIPAGGVMALFAGRRAAASFNTRVAIRRAVDMLGLGPGDEVLAPAWNCGSELDPLLAAGLTLRLYGAGGVADAQGTVDPDALARMIGPATRAVYLIHYFGFLQPHAAAIRALCDARGLWLIEDCALSLLSGPAMTGPETAGRADGRAGHVALFCLYKFFPVLGGGVLVVNAPDLPDPAPFAKAPPLRPVVTQALRAGLGPLVPWLAARRRRSGAADPAPPAAEGLPDMPGHYYFDPDLAERGISRGTLRAVAGVDVAAECRARRAGHARGLAVLEGQAGLRPLFPQLTPGTVPLGLAVQVPPGQRDALVRALQAEAIAATPWWAGYHRGLDFSGQPAARALKDGTVFLPLGSGGGEAGIEHAVARLVALLRAGRG